MVGFGVRGTGSGGGRASVEAPGGAVAETGRRRTQRERLLAGTVAAANRDGYAAVTVSRIIAEAGVSRPTFYDYFPDKDGCFIAALQEIQQRVLAQIEGAVAERRPEQAMQASVRALVRFADEEPGDALFLTSQAMAGGPRMLDARDSGIAEIEGVIEAARAEVAAEALVADVSPRVAIGGTQRLLAARLRRGEPRVGRGLAGLEAWLECYLRPAGRQAWRALDPRPPRPAAAGPGLGALPAPGRRVQAGPDSSRAALAANRRQRILYAAAQLAEAQGYNATTIADITRVAGIDGRAFYEAFADKQDAFMAVHELGVQQVMSATASAFFTGASWPERVWEAGRAFTGFLEENAMIAHVGFVEAYAVGPGAVQRVEDSHVTFTIFLQEGYRHKPRQNPPSRLALEAIITSIFEIVYLRTRRAGERGLTGMLGAMAFLALAPFLGAEPASDFSERRLAPGAGKRAI